MVQRKVPSKLGIQADHVKSDKRLANLKLSSSQLQDGKTRGADMKKKMKKSRSIKLSDLENLRSSPSERSFSQPGKPPPPLQVVASPQKQQPLIRTSDGSPNYMKPTSSSDAKKELFPVSLRNSQTAFSDCKNQLQKASSNSKASSVSGKKPAKTSTRSCSLKLTKTPSFKPSRACPRKSSTVALCADMNAQRATCSSTLKDSKFPPYLMLNPGATESEGTSAKKVCPYTYCSLNGHRHASVPPLKSFLSARRRILKTQKSMKLEALSPRRLKVPCEPEKDSDIFMDFFIEIYDKKNEDEDEDEVGNLDSTKELEVDDEDIKQAIASVSDGSPESEIDFEEDFKKGFDDVAIEADTNGSFLQEQKAEYEDENQFPICSGEEMSMGSYCSEISYEGEHLDSIEMDGFKSEASDMEWEHEEDVDSSALTEEIDSKVESLSDSSHDVSVMWLDDIISIYYEDVLADEVLPHASAEESTCFKAQPQGIVCDLERTNESTETKEQPYLTEKMFQELADADENSGENETSMNTKEFSSNLSEKTFEEPKESGEENQEKNEVPDAENLMNKTPLELGDIETDEDRRKVEMEKNAETDQDVAVGDKMEKEDDADINEQLMENYVSDLPQDFCEAAMVDSSQGQKTSEPCEVDDGSIKPDMGITLSDMPNRSTNFVQDPELLEKDNEEDPEQNTGKNWKGVIRRKRDIEDEEEMRKFNPREPNFLPLVPDPEAEKVDLRHQMMDERKNAEEWMLDYALRQTVTKLAPARKRKVALLVEAFETVSPMPKCEAHIRNEPSFAHARPIQACR